MRRGTLARAWPGISVVAIGLTALLVVLAVNAPSAVPEADPEVTLEASVDAGRELYAAHCAACHGAQLEGDTAPELSAEGLHDRHPTALDLYQYIKDRMPADGVGPGGLTDPEYLAVTAFVLEERGVRGAGVLTLASAAGMSVAATPAPAPTRRPPTATPTPTEAVVLTPAASGNTPPQAPAIVEPALLWRGLWPQFVRLQSGRFVDADPGDRHTGTDFEIRELDRYATDRGDQHQASADEMRQLEQLPRVWAATVTAAPLDQATLETGVFEGPLAGRMSLDHRRVYTIRVRHRDSSGDPASEWSAWSEPTVAWTLRQGVVPPRPMRVRDIQQHSLRWEAADGAPVALGASNALLITGSDSHLHEITGAAPINAVRDFEPAERYVSVFFKFSAGADGLEVPASTLSFIDALGVRRTVWLPWMRLEAGATLIGAPSAMGSFYFEPDDTPLGRADTHPYLFKHSRGRVPEVPWRVVEGFRVELVAGGLTLPVQLAVVPTPSEDPGAPVAYITELHGTVKALGNDGSIWTFATNVLNARPADPPSLPKGEAGTSGIAVDPVTGDVYVSTVVGRDGERYNRIVRLESDDGGRTAARTVDVLRMDDEATGPSHQIHGLLFGHDGQLYAAVGDGGGDDGPNRHRAQDDAAFGGKVLRLQRDGSAPPDNPWFDPAHPDAPVSYQWAKGIRNIFALAQRPGDDGIYAAENGIGIDRLLRLDPGGNYGRPYDEGGPGHEGLVFFGPPSVAPVGTAFASGGVFPPERQGRLYIGTFGVPFLRGPVDRGKEIWEIELDAGGAVARPPAVFVQYIGDGRATITGVAYLPDGLYFVDFFNDYPPEDDPGAAGARLWRVVPDAG